MILSTATTPRPEGQPFGSLRRIAITGTALAMILGLGACTNPYDPGQRALGGAAIGAGAGAAIGAASGGTAATGALIGGALGAAAGALTTPPPPSNGYASAPPPPPTGYGYPPPPPPVGYYPNMVWLPSAGVYVAMNYPRPLFYFGGLYYNFYGGRWYAGPRYNGPWRIHHPPPRLRDFRERHWHDYRARARDHYRRNPHWRHFEPH